MTLRRQGLLPRRLLEGISGKLRWPWGGGRERSETGSCLILVPSVSRIMPKTVPIPSASGFGLWVLDADQHLFIQGIWSTRDKVTLKTFNG